MVPSRSAHHLISEPWGERALALLRGTNPHLTSEGQLTSFQGVVERLQHSSPGGLEAALIHDPATWSSAWVDSYPQHCRGRWHDARLDLSENSPRVGMAPDPESM